MYVSDFALFSRLFLISELKCCSCVVFRFFMCISKKHLYVSVLEIVLSINVVGFHFVFVLIVTR